VVLRIIKIEPEKRRMGLSLKRAAEEQYAVVEWAPADDDEADAVIADAVAEKAEAKALAEETPEEETIEDAQEQIEAVLVDESEESAESAESAEEAVEEKVEA
jgi:hypothetical protein